MSVKTEIAFRNGFCPFWHLPYFPHSHGGCFQFYSAALDKQR